ncbi:MAG TPA: PAS domain S-box protein [Rhodothermales bacterium]|nr:PAS domain S-box protein [Rhodothermales bacterium]
MTYPVNLPDWASPFQDDMLTNTEDQRVSDSVVAQLDETGRVLMVNLKAEAEWGLVKGMRVPRAFMYTLRTQVPDEQGVYVVESSLGQLHVLHLQQQGGWLLMSKPVAFGGSSIPESPSAFKALIEKVPIFILHMNADGTVLQTNTESERITGYTALETQNRPFLLEILHPEDRWKFTKALRDVRDAKKITFGARFQRKHENEETRFAEIHLYLAAQETIGEVEAVIFDVTDQSEVDADLFLSESLYRVFLEQTPTGVIHLDETGIVTFENHRFRQLVGESPEAAWIGQNIYALRPFGTEVEDHIRQMLRTGTEFGNVETCLQIMHRTEEQFLTVHGAPIHHPGGDIVGGVLLVEDITHRKQQEILRDRQKSYVQAEAALREALFDHESQTSFLERAVEILAQATTADRVTVFLRADKDNHYHAHAVWPSEGQEPLPFESLNAADFPILMRTLIDREVLHLNRSHPLTPDAILLLNRSGMFEAIWEPFFENGRPFGFVAFEAHHPSDIQTWDATERSFIEKLTHTFEALWGRITAEVRYNQTVAAIDECLFNFEFSPDDSRSYTFVTPQIDKLIGYPPELLLNREKGRVDWLRQIVNPADHAEVTAHDQRLRSGIGSEVTYRVLHRDGSLRWLRESASPHRDSSRRVTVGGILIDVTEQKTAESDLINAKRAAESANELKSAFLATMSHEIRTPLGAVNGFAELLARELAEVEEKTKRPMPAQVTEFVIAIRENSQRLLTLVNDLFDLSNLEIGVMSIRHISVPLHEVVLKATSKAAVALSQKGVELKLNLAQQEPVVIGDPQRIQQVLENLLENAAKFTEQGSVTVTSSKFDTEVAIEITDTGVGMSEEYAAHLFTPFMQEDRRLNRRFKGTGLGLALVKRILELMRGRVEVESEKGKGSTFRIWLPLAQPAT